MHASKSGRDATLRKPEPGDEFAIYKLIKESPPLDPNSIYSYHLLCRHFRDTCMVAEHNGEIVGFISAYLEPTRAQTLFVWQVVVAASQRGQGLAKTMLDALFDRPSCSAVDMLESTVNPSNLASRKLFESFARHHTYPLNESVFLEEDQFGDQEHEKEILLSIGPFTPGSSEQEK